MMALGFGPTHAAKPHDNARRQPRRTAGRYFTLYQTEFSLRHLRAEHPEVLAAGDLPKLPYGWRQSLV
jgi:hypothetical protein